MGEEVLNADGEVVVGVEQAGGFADDAVAVVVGVAGPGDVVGSLLAIMLAIAKGEEQSMRMRESQSRVMKRKVGSV